MRIICSRSDATMTLMARSNLLFICFANTCRSPMAEAIARRELGAFADVFSAGHRPTGSVADYSIRTLEALGYNATGLSSKGFDAVPLDEMDVIVSLMGAEGLIGLPQHLTAEKIVWSIRDPYGEDEASYLATAATLERHVKQLADVLGGRELSLL